MKSILYAMAIASIIAISCCISSCGEETEKEGKKETEEEVVSFDGESFDEYEYEEETPPKDTSYFIDENDYYKAFIKYEDHDSVSFSIVYLVDKKNGSVIQVTDPAPYFYKNHIEARMWIDDPRVEFSGSSKSIGNASDVKLISKKKHPWQLALYCAGCQHNFSTMIVTENDSSYESLYNQMYLGRSKYEDVFYFNEEQEDSQYNTSFSSCLVIYNSDFKELRRKSIRVDYSERNGKKRVAKPLGINGVKVDFSSIKDTICSYKNIWAFDESKYQNAVVYDTKGDNGDIISYVVLNPGNVTYKMPSNDGFVDGIIEEGILFRSYGTYPNGKKYTILQVFDDEMRMVHEVNASLYPTSN